MMLGAAMAASAASIFDITFPIPELGNCANKEACKTYCDDVSHADDCAAFGKAHGLGNQASQQTTTALSAGPGGCASASACKTYCDDAAHFNECINFAEQHGLLSKKEIQQARKPVTKGPGGCSGIEECKVYCGDAAHNLECAAFAHENGQISDSDYQKTKDVTEKGGPGGCKSEQECRTYCNDASHLDECLAFAESHALVSHDNATAIRKTGLTGTGPGGCHGNDACKAYCEMTAHQNECINFAERKGFMTKEDADQARKFAGKTGPGGCVGQEQCRAYCEDSAHTQECLNQAEQNGLLSKQEIDQAHRFINAVDQGGPGGCKGAKECQAYCQDPAHQDECLGFGKKQGLVGSQDEKEFQAGLKIRKTVEQSGGPGGCKNDDECRTYCSDASHTEECVAFAAAHGGIAEDQAQKMLRQFTVGKFSSTNASPDAFQQAQQNSVHRFQEFKQLEQQFRGLGGPQTQETGGTQFGSPPGALPGQQPGEAGSTGGGGNTASPPPGFVGPGGCTKGADCITYCADHKDECFNHASAPSGQQEQGNATGNQNDQTNTHFRQGPAGFAQPPQMPPPQLRSDIVHQIKPQDLPQGFEQRSREEKQQFFKEKFQEFKAQPGTFPGKPSEGFPGQNRTESESNKNENNGSQEGASDTFRGIAPGQGTRGIFAPIQNNQQQDSSEGSPGSSDKEREQGRFPFGPGGNTEQNQNRTFPSKGFMPRENSYDKSSGAQFQPRTREQMPAGIPPGMSYPKEGERYPAQPSGQFQPRPGGAYPQYPSGSTGSYPQPSGGSFPQQQYQNGSTAGYPAPSGGAFPQQQGFPSSGDINGGSMPPPPSGGSATGGYPVPSSGTGGSFQPPSGGTYPQYPSSGAAGYPTQPSGQFQAPPSGDAGGSMPPPPSGGTTGASGGSQPPPPSSFAPSHGFFASIIRFFFAQ